MPIWSTIFVPVVRHGQTSQAVLVHNGTGVYTFSVLFHDAELPEHLQRPSFVCAFNSGGETKPTGNWGALDLHWILLLQQMGICCDLLGTLNWLLCVLTALHLDGF